LFRLSLTEYIRQTRLIVHELKLNIRKLLICGLVLSLIYLSLSFSAFYPSVNINAKIANQNNSLKMAKRVSQPYNFYLEGIKARNIFGSFSAAGYTGRALSDSSSDLNNINLVGVITGIRPQAVIEDRKTQKTYSLSEGQSGGGMRVEKIEEKRVTVDYHGQRYELSL
jgi:type II secretory pathway component PulC